jgi:dTDP-glucose 4,6-dehydratase
MHSKKRKLLVTGGAGFIRSSFVRQLCNCGYRNVHVMDALTYAGDLQRLQSVDGSYDFHNVNISRKTTVEQLFEDLKPEAVVHFAAETHVDRSLLYAQKAIETNVVGTQILLDAARNVGVRRFVYISTDEVYGEIAQGSFDEDSPLNPSSPYSVGKAAGDMLLRAYVRTHQFPGIVVRPSNNYGPWQYPEKLLPVVIFKAMQGERVPVYGRGANVREWLYVDDCASAILAVLRKGQMGSIYNVGSGLHVRNIDIVKKVMDVLGCSVDLIEFVADRPGHDFRYAVNSEKIRQELRWAPQVDLDDGLKRTVLFYKKNSNWLKKKVRSVRSFWKTVYKSH